MESFIPLAFASSSGDESLRNVGKELMQSLLGEMQLASTFPQGKDGPFRSIQRPQTTDDVVNDRFQRFKPLLEQLKIVLSQATEERRPARRRRALRQIAAGGILAAVLAGVVSLWHGAQYRALDLLEIDIAQRQVSESGRAFEPKASGGGPEIPVGFYRTEFSPRKWSNTEVEGLLNQIRDLTEPEAFEPILPQELRDSTVESVSWGGEFAWGEHWNFTPQEYRNLIQALQRHVWYLQAGMGEERPLADLWQEAARVQSQKHSLQNQDRIAYGIVGGLFLLFMGNALRLSGKKRDKRLILERIMAGFSSEARRLSATDDAEVRVRVVAAVEAVHRSAAALASMREDVHDCADALGVQENSMAAAPK